MFTFFKELKEIRNICNDYQEFKKQVIAKQEVDDHFATTCINQLRNIQEMLFKQSVPVVKKAKANKVKKSKLTKSKTMNLGIQRYISSIYEAMDLLNTCAQLTEIRYWLISSQLGENENYIGAILLLDKEKKQVVRHLTRLSEMVDDLEVCINQCLHLIQIEVRKDKKFAAKYEKYHARLTKNKKQVAA